VDFASSSRRQAHLNDPVGVGVGLRRELEDALLTTARRVDWLEVIPESYIGKHGRTARALDALRERHCLVPHGVSLSIGGPDPLDVGLDELAPFVERLDPAFVSEHLSWSSAHGEQTLDLLPLPFTDEAVEHVARRARLVAARLGRPLVLENVTYYAEMPGGTMSEAAFVSRVLEEADAGLLLDLNNLYVNAVNHGRSPVRDLLAMPLGRVRQVHLAGHSRDGELLLDTHDGPVCDPVWELLRTLVEHIGPVPTLIEWDQAIPSLDRVLDEADRARALIASAAARAA
jgi:hypothetical protein